MALDFNNSNGGAKSSKIDYFKLTDGDNVFRMFGGILPRYVYWLKDRNNKPVCLECLSFNRDTEVFDNVQRDYVQEYFPEEKCSWAYLIEVLDPSDNTIKVLQLKKKLLGQIKEAAADLGDPTNLDTGYELTVKRKKTGPNAFNVEDSLNVLRCKPSAVSDEQRKAIEESKGIDALYTRQTPEEQLALLKSRVLPEDREMEEMASSEDSTSNDDFDDDIPF